MKEGPKQGGKKERDDVRKNRKEGGREGRREDRLTTPHAWIDGTFTSICFALVTDLRVT